MQMSRARRDTAKKSASIRTTTSYRGASIRREWFRDTVQIRRQTRQPSWTGKYDRERVAARRRAIYVRSPASLVRSDL